MFSGQENGHGISIFKWKPNRLSQSSSNIPADSNVQFHSISSKDVRHVNNNDDRESHKQQSKSSLVCNTSDIQIPLPKSNSTDAIKPSKPGNLTSVTNNSRTGSLPPSSKGSSGPRYRHITFLRIECLVAAHRVQQSAERLLLSSEIYPPSLQQNLQYDRIASQVDILKLRTETLMCRVVPSLSNYGSSHSMSLDEASECIRGLELNCISVVKDVYSYCFQRVSALRNVNVPAVGKLNKLDIVESCDDHLSAVYGLELSVSEPLLDSPRLVTLCERLSTTLSSLNKACLTDFGEASIQHMDLDALNHGMRVVTACTSFLLHTVRSVYHQPDDPECRGRVDLASGALRPAVTAVKHIAGESKFVGKPISLSGESKALRYKIFCYALPLASAIVEFFTCLGSFLQIHCGNASENVEILNQLQRCAKAVTDACADCLKLPVTAYIGTEL